MKNYLILFLLFSLSVSGAVVDYRALRQDQFTTNLPSPGYVGIRGSGITNISGTNINISAGGSIVFTTNGPNITITVTGLGQATNVSLVPGTNIFIATNGSGTFTISGLNYWRTNAAYANGVSNLYSGPVVIGDPRKSGGDPNSILVVSRIVGSDDTSTGDTLLGYIQFATDVSGNTTLFGGDNNTLTIQSDGNMYFNGGTLYDFKNGSPMHGNGTSLTNLNGTNIDIVYDGGLTASSNGVHRVTVSINTNAVLSLATNVVNNNTVQGITGGTTNFATTNTSAGLTNATSSIVSNQIPNFIHGATNYIGKFTPNTNEMGNSIVIESATNQWEWRSRPSGTAYTNSITNRFYGQYTAENNFSALEIVSSAAVTSVPGGSSEYSQFHDKQGSSSTSLSFPCDFMDAWRMYSGVNAPGGFAIGRLEPLVHNTYDFGTAAASVGAIFSRNIGVINNSSSANVYGVSGYGMGMNVKDIRIYDALGNQLLEVSSLSSGPGNYTGLNLGTGSLCANTFNDFGTPNIYLRGNPSRDAGVWMFGTNNTASSKPITYHLTGEWGSGTDKAGGDNFFEGGGSTGTGKGGDVGFSTYTNQASSANPNGRVTRENICGHEITLTESSATLVANVSIPANDFVGIRCMMTTHADDGTDYQCVNETFCIAVVNKATTVTTSISASSPIATIQSSGTLTTTWTAVANGNGVDIKCSSVSSLTQTTLKVTGRLEIDSNGPAAVTWQ